MRFACYITDASKALILIELPPPNFWEYICLLTLNGTHMLTKFMLKSFKAFKRLYFFTCSKRAGIEENKLLDFYRSVIRSVVEYACPAWSTGITKGQSESLEQNQKCAMYIIAPLLQYKEAITKFNLPTINDHLDILNGNYFQKYCRQ